MSQVKVPADRATRPVTVRVRLTTRADLPALRMLIAESVRGLSIGFYDQRQIESAIAHVFGPDTQLIDDGTYYVIEAGNDMVAAGGWSRRKTLYGGDQTKHGPDPLLDPLSEPARIRAFFVHPSWARRRMGRLLFATCHDAARDAGFHALELVATLPGVPLYKSLGFTPEDELRVPLPNDLDLPCIRMTRAIDRTK